MDTGYAFMNQMLKQEFLVTNLIVALAALMVLKIVATSLTVGSGGSGGVFAPSIFIGGTLGAAIGNLANQALDKPFQNPGAYALVGMAAALGATIQAPFTAMIMIVEMTNDYSLVVPLMLAVAISALVYNHYLRYSAFTLKLHQLGVHRRAFHDVNVLEEIQVGEIMHKGIEGIHEDTPYDEAYHTTFSSHHNGFPVVDDEGLLVGIITESDFGRHIITDTKRAHETRLKEVMSTHVKTVYPDMPVWEVHKMFDKLRLGRFPVVSRENPRKILGIVTRSDIVHAYPLALKRHEVEFEI
jgi:CIC family chloride channel protein